MAETVLREKIVEFMIHELTVGRTEKCFPPFVQTDIDLFLEKNEKIIQRAVNKFIAHEELKFSDIGDHLFISWSCASHYLWAGSFVLDGFNSLCTADHYENTSNVCFY